jgi:hypothetical protein
MDPCWLNVYRDDGAVNIEAPSAEVLERALRSLQPDEAYGLELYRDEASGLQVVRTGRDAWYVQSVEQPDRPMLCVREQPLTVALSILTAYAAGEDHRLGLTWTPVTDDEPLVFVPLDDDDSDAVLSYDPPTPQPFRYRNLEASDQIEGLIGYYQLAESTGGNGVRRALGRAGGE